MNRNELLANEVVNVLGAAEMLCGPSADAEVVILKTIDKFVTGAPTAIEQESGYHTTLSLSSEIAQAVNFGLTRDQIAEALGVGIHSIIRWENGFNLPETHIQKIFIDELREQTLSYRAKLVYDRSFVEEWKKNLR